MSQSLSRSSVRLPALTPLASRYPESQVADGHPEHQVTSEDVLPISVARKLKTSTKTAEEWESRKLDIHQLYVIQDRPLPEVMRILEWEKFFSQSRKQYTTKLKEWGYAKNIKESDMRTLVCKDLKRKAEDPLRLSSFRLRGKSVPPQRIERYEKDKGLTSDDAIMAEATPSAISCETPRSPPESLAREPEESYEVDGGGSSSLIETVNVIWTRILSANFKGQESIESMMLESIALPPSLSSWPNPIDISLRLDLAAADAKLMFNALNDHALSWEAESHESQYSLELLLRLSHGRSTPCDKEAMTQIRLQWKYGDSLITEGIVRVEPKHQPPQLDGLASRGPDRLAERTTRGWEVEKTTEMPEHESCQCTLCCLTLSQEVPADQEMELFKQLSLSTRLTHHCDPTHLGGNCSVCFLDLASDELAKSDLESLWSLSSQTGGWICLYETKDFELVWCHQDL